jgi:HEAT repeat protein
VAEILWRIKDARSVEPFIEALKNDEPWVRWWAARALAEMKDERAIEPLLAALRNEDLDIIAGGYIFYIGRGEKGSETSLIKALAKNGNKEMADIFLNCGNDQLRKAATEWAEFHQYTIIEVEPGTEVLLWGSGK